jgi:sugar lactone lactonase YvrE
LSPDEKTLYVAVSDPQDTRVIAYDLATPGAASRLVFNAQSSSHRSAKAAAMA